MTPVEAIVAWWPLLLTGASVVVWVVRIEAKAAGNTREIERLWIQRKEDMQAAKDARDATNEILREIRSDIKKLMNRSPG